MDKSDFRLNADLKKELKNTAILNNLTYAEYCRMIIEAGHKNFKKIK